MVMEKNLIEILESLACTSEWGPNNNAVGHTKKLCKKMYQNHILKLSKLTFI